MNSSIDLNLLHLARQETNLTSDLPDLYAVTPPRRAARGRESDSLIIYLTMTGNSPLLPEAQAQLLENLAQKFYKTTGSLTAALRTIVEALNLYLLDRNLRSTSMGRQGIGQVILVALRAETIYMAHSGMVHAFIVTPTQTQHIYDPQSSGRGLGYSRTAPIRFLQAKLSAGDYLVLSTIASSNWSEDTFHTPQAIESLRSQLLEATSQDFNAVLIQAQAGSGKLNILRRKIESTDEAQMVEAIQTEVATGSITATPEAGTTAEPLEANKPAIPSEEGPRIDLVAEPGITETPERPGETVPVVETPGALPQEKIVEGTSDTEASVAAEVTVMPEEGPAISALAPTATAEPPVTVDSAITSPSLPSVEPTPSLAAPPTRRVQEKRAPKPIPWAKPLASFRTTLAPITSAILRALQSALGTIGAASLRLLRNLLPDAEVLRLPPSIMVFFAIAIPLILAVTGVFIFLQRGRAQQYQVYYQQAVEQANQAASLTEPMEQRQALQNAIKNLNTAEYYTPTSQSQELRSKLVSQLDTLDAVKRLDYKPAIVGGLEAQVSVTRMIATTTELYLLNGNQGNVLRAIMTGRGYELDPNFQCGQTYGPINVGPLVDIVELPPGSFEDATVLGMDANGNLLYCVPGSQPYSAVMAPPNTGFNEPSGLSLDRGDLFILDPKVNAVWIYRNMEVRQQPHLFFGETVPRMQDVIDLAVYNEDLFLLHADGHITKCIYSSMAESPTRCDDPYPYSDNRPGRSHGPLIADAVFNQIYFSSFPERSIFMLDPKNQSIYYFSLLMTLQWQYQSKSALSIGSATSFAISPNRMAFLAVGNNVYYAAIP